MKKNSTSAFIASLKSLSIGLCLLLLAAGSALEAQTFHTYGGVIPNNSTGNCFSLNVGTIGNLTASHGIVRVCLSINQARPADLDISLRSPDGTVVSLSTDNGGTSGNDYYEGMCFSDCGPSGPITSGSNFRGVYLPEAALSTFNSGVSGDGIWQLCIDDDNALGGDGTLNYWSLSFNTITPPSTPSGETCALAYPLTNLPFEHTCMTLAGSLDNYSACTGMMEGADYLYAYTPADTDEYLSIDIAQDFFAPSGFPTVLLLDTCPDVAFPANCIQYEIQMNSTENILHITSQPMKQGKTYYIVAASTSGTGGTYDMRISSGKNGNENCLQATVIDQEKEYAGNNYLAADPNLQAPNTTEMPCNGSIDNFIYYTFTTDAVGSTVYVNVTDIDCDLSCGGSCGIQLALFQEPVGGACLGPGSWGAPVYCESSTETNEYYAWTGLVPNTRYYLMVDGNAGSKCVWNLRAMGDFVQILPVQLSDLAVRHTSGVNLLTWKTLSEVNFSHYMVEHSRSLPDFEKVGQVEARGQNKGEANYTFSHPAAEKGWHYYRLRNVDLNGKETFSAIVQVYVEGEENSFEIYPNPARDEVFVKIEAEGATSLRMLDLNGRELSRSVLPSNSGPQTHRLDLNGMQAGIFLLELDFRNGTRKLEKLVVSN
ncbi:MAG: proprotein convertase P-domain-containing protein [Bacteroidia bacterium]|nr:proprotein convertase P-domain-containing protein [Bacteroidia bacterium]